MFTMPTKQLTNLKRLLLTGEPFKCTGTVAEMQKLFDALPPALAFVDYPGDGNERVTLTYYPRRPGFVMEH
jgi:hypothetical protein